MLPREIDQAMAGARTADGWTFWYPIPSRVTDTEIQDFEDQIGEAGFSHPVNTWRRAHVDLIDSGYPREFLIDKGYLPIASWSDWGLLCFDTNRGDPECNYPVVLWDHERARQVTPLYPTFTELLQGLDREASEKKREE